MCVLNQLWWSVYHLPSTIYQLPYVYRDAAGNTILAFFFSYFICFVSILCVVLVDSVLIVYFCVLLWYFCMLFVCAFCEGSVFLLCFNMMIVYFYDYCFSVFLSMFVFIYFVSLCANLFFITLSVFINIYISIWCT